MKLKRKSVILILFLLIVGLLVVSIFIAGCGGGGGGGAATKLCCTNKAGAGFKSYKNSCEGDSNCDDKKLCINAKGCRWVC